jgi:hypothetical protein
MFSLAFIVAPELNIDLYIKYSNVLASAKAILRGSKIEGNADVERTSTDLKILDRCNVVAAGTDCCLICP